MVFIRRRLPQALLLCSAALLASGCSGQSAQESAPSTADASESVSSTKEASEASTEASGTTEKDEPKAEQPELSERGALMKKQGEPAGLLNPDNPDKDKPLLEFTIKSIEKNPTCTGEFAEKPENGALVALEVEMQVAPGASEYGIDGSTLAGTKVIRSNGETYPGALDTIAAWSCVDDAERLDFWIGDGEKTSGTLVLDIPEDAETLLITDGLSGSKWEWAL